MSQTLDHILDRMIRAEAEVTRLNGNISQQAYTISDQRYRADSYAKLLREARELIEVATLAVHRDTADELVSRIDTAVGPAS